MKRKFVLSVITGLLVILNTSNVYAWGGKTHSYLEEKYYKGYYKDDIEEIAIASEYIGVFTLNNNERDELDNIRKMVIAFEYLKIEGKLKTPEEYIFAEAVKKQFDREGSYNMIDLDSQLRNLGLRNFYYNTNAVANSLSSLKLKGYIDTFTKGGLDNTEEYFAYAKKLPYNTIMSVYLELMDTTLTIDGMQKDIIRNHLIREVGERLNWDMKIVDKDSYPVLVPNTYDKETEETINNYFESKFGKTNAYLAENSNKDSMNEIIYDVEFRNKLETSSKEVLEKILSENIFDLKDNGEIILKDKEKYDSAIIDLYTILDDFSSKYYSKEDINKDGKIDVYDLTKVSMSYSIQDTDKAYIKNNDINKDGIIDLFDLVEVSKKI